jgi:hypothetical protein
MDMTITWPKMTRPTPWQRPALSLSKGGLDDPPLCAIESPMRGGKGWTSTHTAAGRAFFNYELDKAPLLAARLKRLDDMFVCPEQDWL